MCWKLYKLPIPDVHKLHGAVPMRHRTYATSNIKVLYDNTEPPQHEAEFFSAMHQVLALCGRRHEVDNKDTQRFAKRMRGQIEEGIRTSGGKFDCLVDSAIL